MTIKCSNQGCSKKITLVDNVSGKCKCGLKFCQIHRLAEQHECIYNFKTENDAKEFIARNKCINAKILPI